MNLLTSAPDALASAGNIWRNSAGGPASPGSRRSGSRRAAVARGGSRRSAQPRRMGGMGGDLSRRQAAAGGRRAGLAAPADGAERTGVPRLCEFRCVFPVELVARLYDHRRLFRDPARRRAEGRARQRQRGRSQPRGRPASCSRSSGPWLRRRQDRRRHRRADARGGEASRSNSGCRRIYIHRRSCWRSCGEGRRRASRPPLWRDPTLGYDEFEWAESSGRDAPSCELTRYD